MLCTLLYTLHKREQVYWHAVQHRCAVCRWQTASGATGSAAVQLHCGRSLSYMSALAWCMIAGTVALPLSILKDFVKTSSLFCLPPSWACGCPACSLGVACTPASIVHTFCSGQQSWLVQRLSILAENSIGASGASLIPGTATTSNLRLVWHAVECVCCSGWPPIRSWSL